MPIFPSVLRYNQKTPFDTPMYLSGENSTVLDHTLTADEIFYALCSSPIEELDEDVDLAKRALETKGEPAETSSVTGQDYLSHDDEDEHVISKQNYFGFFWGDNWFLDLKRSSSSDTVSDEGGVEKWENSHSSSHPKTEEDGGVWQSNDGNYVDVDKHSSLEYESWVYDELRNMSAGKDDYGVDGVRDRYKSVYGSVEVEAGLQECVFGDSPSLSLAGDSEEG